MASPNAHLDGYAKVDVGRLLLAHHADVTRLNNKGLTPFHIMAENLYFDHEMALVRSLIYTAVILSPPHYTTRNHPPPRA